MAPTGSLGHVRWVAIHAAAKRPTRTSNTPQTEALDSKDPQTRDIAVS
jgi:hypothetical protein